MQLLKGAVFCALKILIAMVTFILKLLMVLIAVMLFSVMLFGGLSAFLAVGPMHTPNWMAGAWNLLNEVDPARLMDALDRDPSPLWETREPSVIVSRWMVQFLPVTDLLATAAGVAKDHWLLAEVTLGIQHLGSLVQTEPKIGQGVAAIWVVSTISSLYLMVRLFLAGTRMLGRSLRRLVRAVCPARATTDTAANVPDGAGTTPKGVQVLPALGENTRSNIVAESVMTSEKKGRRRLESPHVKNKGGNKEDVPPYMASPLRRKQSELIALREQGLVGTRLGRN